jgi:hypothetical protein
MLTLVSASASLIRFLARSEYSGNCRVHESMMAFTNQSISQLHRHFSSPFQPSLTIVGFLTKLFFSTSQVLVRRLKKDKTARNQFNDGQKKNCIPVTTWYNRAWVGWHQHLIRIDVSLLIAIMMTYL